MPMFCLIFTMPTQRSFEALKMPIQFVANGAGEALGGGARGLANQREPASGLAPHYPARRGRLASAKETPIGIKGRANQELSASHQRLTGQTTYHQIPWNLGARNLTLRRRSSTSPSRAARGA
jgi:hypothetical protein